MSQGPECLHSYWFGIVHTLVSSERTRAMLSGRRLGTGCANCKNTPKRVQVIVAEKGISANFEKVEDMSQLPK